MNDRRWGDGREANFKKGQIRKRQINKKVIYIYELKIATQMVYIYKYFIYNIY